MPQVRRGHHLQRAHPAVRRDRRGARAGAASLQEQAQEALRTGECNHTVLVVKLARIMSYIFHCKRALYSTHTNDTYRCHKVTALAKDVKRNLLGRETHDCSAMYRV